MKWYPVILAIFLSAGSLASVHADPVLLFSEEEAQQLRLSEQELIDLRPARTRKLILGPEIQIKKPKVEDRSDGDTIVTQTPVSLLVEFIEKGASVDMETLQVKAKKGWFSVSLTKKLKPYIKGNTIEADSLEIPAGRFLIEIYIADVNGTDTTVSYGLEVFEP